jgi:biotin carboxyl carrier protein
LHFDAVYAVSSGIAPPEPGEIAHFNQFPDIFYRRPDSDPAAPVSQQLRVRCEDHDRPGAREDAGTGLLVAPMPGRVIAVLVDRDARVEKGQALMVIEAMKMEHTIYAPAAGTVTVVSFADGDLVEEGVELLTIAPAGGN